MKNLGVEVTQQSLVDILVSMHKPEHLSGDMVYEVWNDGEVTLTKGGDLYGQRSLHMLERGCYSKALPVGLFPIECHRYVHARIVVSGYITAMQARNLIVGD